MEHVGYSDAKGRAQLFVGSETSHAKNGNLIYSFKSAARICNIFLGVYLVNLRSTCSLFQSFPILIDERDDGDTIVLGGKAVSACEQECVLHGGCVS